MTLLELWNRARLLGIQFTQHGDDLRVTWPEADPSPEFVEAIRSHKASILSALVHRPPKPSGAPYDDAVIPDGSPHAGSTIGQVRTLVATAAMEAGLGHTGLRRMTVRVTGTDSLWALGPEDLHRVERAVHALAGKTERTTDG